MVSLHRRTRSIVLRPGQEPSTYNCPTGIATTESILADSPDEGQDGNGGEDMTHVGDARRGDGAGEHKVNHHLELRQYEYPSSPDSYIGVDEESLGKRVDTYR